MANLSKKKQVSRIEKRNGEIKIRACAVSRGISVGKVVCLHGDKRQFYRIKLKKSQIKSEQRRFRAAVRLSKLQLKKISETKTGKFNESKPNILEAHRLILEDQSLHSKIENFIEEKKVNAEWAVKIITDAYIADYKTITDEHLRERYIDLEDITERLLSALGGGGRKNFRLEKNSVIVAEEIKPSTLIELSESNPKAVITERGGWTSHSFILAREINLPAVTGIKGILRHAKNGESVIVDGYSGLVIFNPSAETASEYKMDAGDVTPDKDASDFNGILKTLDGREITIRGNADFPKAYEKAKQSGAKGIGLYRSEFLFEHNKKGYPSERKQIEIYRKIAALCGTDGVKIRTFDLSREQFAEKEQNPALGLRGIRLALFEKKQFRTQLRAILQASVDTNIDIVLPMVSDVSEILLARKILESEKSKLRKRNIAYGKPRLGAMIEIPATIFILEELARAVDFLSLGTNDLVQYLLAADRDNELVADWFRTLHPAVIRAVKKIIETTEESGIPLIICGEMAGSPVYAAILVGLGAKELSMNWNSISRIRKLIAGIAVEEAREVCRQIEKCQTADEIEKSVTDFFRQKWSHLFSAENSPLKKNQK